MMTGGIPARRKQVAGVLTALAVATGGGGLAALVLPAGAAGVTLAEAGARTGRPIGVAVTGSRLVNDQAYAEIVAREFAVVTPENELKFDAVQWQRGVFTFTAADRVVTWARDHDKGVRGYALLAGAPQVPWLAALPVDQQRADMVKHVQTVVGHYRGTIGTWDLVTEAFSDSGQRRPSILERTGSDWIEVAFRAGRSADGEARLCYSDYAIEDWASPKTQAVYALMKDFKARGVPVDCVSLQSHFVSGYRRPASMPTTMAAFASLGLDVEISELDVTGDAAQADTYAQVARDCLALPRCSGLTVWGVRDSDSWLGTQTPLLFDRTGAPKPAYTAFRDALLTPIGCPTRTPSPGTVKPLCSPPTTSAPPSTTTSRPPTSKTVKTTKVRTKKTTTVCRTKKKGSSVTCKVVTRR